MSSFYSPDHMLSSLVPQIREHYAHAASNSLLSFRNNWGKILQNHEKNPTMGAESLRNACVRLLLLDAELTKRGLE